MRSFHIAKLEIWTSSPAQIQVFQKRGQGYKTEHKPAGTLYLLQQDAEGLKKFILEHKAIKVIPYQSTQI
jgi:hypothetical protein